MYINIPWQNAILVRLLRVCFFFAGPRARRVYRARAQPQGIAQEINYAFAGIADDHRLTRTDPRRRNTIRSPDSSQPARECNCTLLILVHARTPYQRAVALFVVSASRKPERGKTRESVGQMTKPIYAAGKVGQSDTTNKTVRPFSRTELDLKLLRMYYSSGFL